MNNPFTGSGVALVTPFNDDFSIDFDALRKLVRYQIDNGTDFLVVQGTTGESPTLSWEEKLAVLKTVQEENNGELKIVFGIGGNNTIEVGKTLKALDSSGIDGILSVSPYYNKPTQKGIMEHYKHIAACTNLPIILYNVPGRTGSNVSASTTLELAKIDNIVAMKEASGDFGQIMEIIQYKPDGFGLLSGDDAITMPMIAAGAEGVISVVANAFPKRFSEMVHASQEGNLSLAREAHYDLLPVTHMLFEEGNPGGVKASLTKQKIMKPTMRLPLYPISSDLQQRIESETERILT
ncbi:MAG: 4-hydroxy-tetrahydrodipicolinate synthase [bacterium]|nr:4-hydroxy-tetrahydrodipicolinate synthase [bacterium]